MTVIWLGEDWRGAEGWRNANFGGRFWLEGDRGIEGKPRLRENCNLRGNEDEGGPWMKEN